MLFCLYIQMEFQGILLQIALKRYNKGINRIREPVALFACAKTPPEPLTSYAGRYAFQ